MGLDNFASRSPDDIVLTQADEEAFEASGLELVGGILSGDSSSFRGKVYAFLVLEVTGESLYDQWLPPETVRRMSAALSEHTPAELVAIHNRVTPVWRYSERQMADLQRFFAICAERGIGLIGWA
jgi:hypothetical protein